MGNGSFFRRKLEIRLEQLSEINIRIKKAEKSTFQESDFSVFACACERLSGVVSSSLKSLSDHSTSLPALFLTHPTHHLHSFKTLKRAFENIVKLELPFDREYFSLSNDVISQKGIFEENTPLISGKF